MAVMRGPAQVQVQVLPWGVQLVGRAGALRCGLRLR